MTDDHGRPTQPVPAPSSAEEYARVRPRLIDTHGRPLVTIDCGPCDGKHLSVEPCLADFPCPTCGSSGTRCKRPSEHDADTWHEARLKLRRQILDEREQAGEPVPARWAPTS